MGSELFLYGDPRYLSGGGSDAVSVDYNKPPKYLSREHVKVTTKFLSPSAGDKKRVADVIGNATHQIIHGGKASYHHRPLLNVFLVKDQFPSAGIELEMLEHSSVNRNELERTLTSNWFHFESDSSLYTSGSQQGYELITEPLPPQAYRDARLWSGLQNTLTPWFESYGSKKTGLHIHVGLDMFGTCDDMGFASPADRRVLGKTASAFLYFALLPRDYVDKVFLRYNTGYCAIPSDTVVHEVIAAIPDSCRTGDDVFRLVSDYLVNTSGVDQWTHMIGDRIPEHLNHCNYCWLPSSTEAFRGHGVEVNCAHQYTIEFRRGKGTLHSLSIHRMVELATLVVRYVWRLARNPELPVSTKEILSFIERSTVSPALRRMTQAALNEL